MGPVSAMDVGKHGKIMELGVLFDGISAETIRGELKTIIEDPEFEATDKLRAFLRFVVEETLEGRADQLKGYTIATAVFGRSEDFDPAHDPVVRIQAGRLRRALERYYLITRDRDPIKIDIPKGGYVPRFSALPGSSYPVPPTPDSRPAVLVRPFADLTRDRETAYLGTGLGTELTLELSRYQDIRVLLHRDGSPAQADPAQKPRFVIEGSLREDAETTRLTVQLVDTANNEQLWGDSFSAPIESARMFSFQESAARAIAARIASDHGLISRTLANETRARKLKDITTYQAILRFHTYDRKTSPETYAAALEALQAATARDPESGSVASMLAVLYADNIALEFMDLESTPVDEALRLARHGALLEPECQLCRFSLGRMHYLLGDVDAALAETEAALALNPGSLCYLDAIGHQLAMLGEWKRGVEMVRSAMHQNPYFRPYVQFAIWLDEFRREQYERAYESAQLLRGAGDFWDPLARAVTLSHLNRLDESQEAARELLSHKPQFRADGRRLIRRFVKFSKIEDQLIEGLLRAGIEID